MRYTFMGLILWLMAGVMTVSAGSLEVEGLGKFPFRHNVEVTAAGGATENFLRAGDDSRQDIEKNDSSFVCAAGHGVLFREWIVF